MPEPRPPSDLLELQRWFASFVTRPLVTAGPYHLPLYETPLVQDIAHHISPTKRLNSEQRIGIYNQQYWWRLFTLLQIHYPTLVRLFGYADFNASLAEPYFLRYPPTSWILSCLGEKLPAWIEDYYHAEDRSIVLEVARVDEVYERLFRLEEGDEIALVCDGDFFAFRKAMLEHPPEHWQTADFPSIQWFKTPREFVVYRTMSGIEHRSCSS